MFPVIQSNWETLQTQEQQIPKESHGLGIGAANYGSISCRLVQVQKQVVYLKIRSRVGLGVPIALRSNPSIRASLALLSRRGLQTSVIKVFVSEKG